MIFTKYGFGVLSKMSKKIKSSYSSMDNREPQSAKYRSYFTVWSDGWPLRWVDLLVKKKKRTKNKNTKQKTVEQQTKIFCFFFSFVLKQKQSIFFFILWNHFQFPLSPLLPASSLHPLLRDCKVSSKCSFCYRQVGFCCFSHTSREDEVYICTTSFM